MKLGSGAVRGPIPGSIEVVVIICDGSRRKVVALLVYGRSSVGLSCCLCAGRGLRP